jgi:hypothetical protein
LFRRAADQGVESAELALCRVCRYRRRTEIVALALQLDSAQVLHAGWATNEAAVKNRDLTRYRIVDFATHGLIPGTLDGLLRTCREL